MSDENLAKRRCCGAAVSRIPVSWRYEIGDVSLFTRHFQNNRVATRRPSPAMRRDVNSEEHGEMLVFGKFFWELCGLKLCHCHCVSLRVTACHCVSLCLADLAVWGAQFSIHAAVMFADFQVEGHLEGRLLLWFGSDEARAEEVEVWPKSTVGRNKRSRCWCSSLQYPAGSSREWCKHPGLWRLWRLSGTLRNLAWAHHNWGAGRQFRSILFCQRNVWVMFQSHRRWSWTSRMESPNGWFLVT